MRALAAIAVALLSAGTWGCRKDGPPPRAVIEQDLEGWSFRRYQKLLDVEVWIADNPAVSHTASYVSALAERRGRLGHGDVVNAVVSRYRREPGIAEALLKLAERLSKDATYQVDEQKIGDVRLLRVVGVGEAWVLWPARGHVVKIGGPDVGEIPSSLIEAYGERYPSRLREGAFDARREGLGGGAKPADRR